MKTSLLYPRHLQWFTEDGSSYIGVSYIDRMVYSNNSICFKDSVLMDHTSGLKVPVTNATKCSHEGRVLAVPV